MNVAPSSRPVLPNVTLIAVTSVNIAATIAALDASMQQVAFGAAKLLSDRVTAPLSGQAEWVRIAPLTSARAYSKFVLNDLVDHVGTSHCLLVQWDGHVLSGDRWQADFLEYDYIGASWPQFIDGHDIGNGGFSLRSRALLEACREPGFRRSHPEDLAIGRHNRAFLEARGLRFAPRSLADAFSAERSGNPFTSFGYHGVWHMPRVLGLEPFWRLYGELDEHTSLRHDFRSILWQVARGRGGARRAYRMIRDRVRDDARSRNGT